MQRSKVTELVEISKSDWESYKKSLPEAIVLRTKAKNTYKFTYFACKFNCEFTVKRGELRDDLEVSLTNREKHVGSLSESNETTQKSMKSEIRNKIIHLLDSQVDFSLLVGMAKIMDL